MITKETKSDFLAGLRHIEPTSIKQVLEFLRQQQYNKLRGAKTDEERLALQNYVKALDSIEEKFLNWREKGLDIT